MLFIPIFVSPLNESFLLYIDYGFEKTNSLVYIQALLWSLNKHPSPLVTDLCFHLN
jgi:hypothetical protein